MEKRILLSFLIALLSTLTFSQNSKKTISFFIGNQGKYCGQTTINSNPDFLNYIDAEGFNGDLIYIGFQGKVNVKEKYKVSAIVGMYSDLAPVNYIISAVYYPKEKIGYGASFIGYPEYISDYFQHFNIYAPGLFPDLNTNYRQQRVYNYGFAVGPEYSIKSPKVELLLRLHAGLRRESVFSDGLYQKRVDDNYIVRYNFETSQGFSPYLFPEVECNFKLFSKNSKEIGVRLHLAGEFTQRKMDYTKTTMEWTPEQKQIERITSAKRNYSKYDLDFGIYYSW